VPRKRREYRCHPGGPGGSDYTYSDKPVIYVDFFDAMRFVTWLENGQPTGAQDASTTEDGVYAISDGLSETRAASATFFIPSEDEWYKAAYHKNDGVTSTYWDYPTSTDSVPNNNLPSADRGNSANFFDGAYTTGNQFFPMTDVGAYTFSESPYGTFDQGGNINELNEGVVFSARVIRSGSWGAVSDILLSSFQGVASPLNYNNIKGFRVASIPEADADIDNNGIVDGFDFLKWQLEMSPNPFSQTDLALWESQYGGPPPVSAVSAVPEPATCIALLLGMMAMLFRRDVVVS